MHLLFHSCCIARGMSNPCTGLMKNTCNMLKKNTSVCHLPVHAVPSSALQSIATMTNIYTADMDLARVSECV